MIHVRLGPAGFTILLLALAGFGAGLAYRGYGFWRGSRSVGEPMEAEATISKLYYKGSRAWGGSYYATVAFVDNEGANRTATIGVMEKIWNHLREGGRIHVTYSAADPERARFGGRIAQTTYAISGFGLMAIGTGLTVFFLWMLVAGWAGWIVLDPFRDMRHGQFLNPPSTAPRRSHRTGASTATDLPRRAGNKISRIEAEPPQCRLPSENFPAPPGVKRK